jgi:DNA (cytosine-5)-methyltransferase 1
VSGAYYNEFEPYAAAWLRKLIQKGLIADGEVDGRSIVDVQPDDLRGFTQCHFFAGIGVWSHALRLAGWQDDRPVWTGSCPCQPFSAAGKGKGFDDERHLWPEFHRLVAECRPPVVFGEQVASKDGLAWLDTVQSDMEASGYAIGAADLCAAGVGAPHIRQRLWFVGERVADANQERREGNLLHPLFRNGEGTGPLGRLAGSGATGGLGHHHHQGLEGQRGGHPAEGGWDGAAGSVAAAGEPRGLADAERAGVRARGQGGAGGPPREMQGGDGERQWLRTDAGSSDDNVGARPRPTNGHWRDADWLHCRDGRWRPVEPGTFPLVDGAPARVGRLRGYGNAIVPQVAAQVIGAYMDIRGSQ